MDDRYREIDGVLIEKLIPFFDLLLVTATDVEEEVLHQNMRPIKGQEKLIRASKGKSTYYLGEFGAYTAVHVSCREMGSSGKSASIVTTIDAINIWHPKAVIMIGIAFGMNKKKQSIGDVLIAERVVNYEPRRVGKTEEELRGKEGPASSQLFDRYKSAKDWKHQVEEGRPASVLPGLIVSGESLVDNLSLRKKLQSEYPTAIGGEMEGAGIYAACDDKVNHWILVKGICDYADGNKGKNKKLFQRQAIDSAVSLSVHVLRSPYALNDIGIKPLIQPIEIDEMVAELQPGYIPHWMRKHVEVLKKEIDHEDK